MKRVFAYYLLVAYLLALLKPALPVIHDELAHTFWRMEHIATVHHFNGENHVHSDMEKANDDNDADDQSTASKFSDPVSAHLLIKTQFEFQNIAYSKSIGCSYLYRLVTIPASVIVPPPKHIIADCWI